MEKPIIAFKLEYSREMGWGAISNFITKFSEKIPMNNLDVELATSILLDAEQPYDNVLLAKKIVQNSFRLKKIVKPENIYSKRR